MKLCSIISTWADTLCLLPFCIQNHLQFCDGVIVLWSSLSNRGESDNGVMQSYISEMERLKISAVVNITFEQLEPIKKLTPLQNETLKRNRGINLARQHGFTHFLIADADEFYIPEDVIEEKKRFDDPNLNGLVCGLFVFIKNPTFWTDDHTLLGFIHKLGKDTKVGIFKDYPFAYDSNGKARIDPSRRINYKNGIEMSDIYMHHMSYVRKDIDLKINNSSANLKRYRQVIYDDLRDAKPGYLSKLYHQELRECENYFNIEI